jgi:multisubunit Na+/H+ antiporter MnhC subunit
MNIILIITVIILAAAVVYLLVSLRKARKRIRKLDIQLSHVNTVELNKAFMKGFVQGVRREQVRVRTQDTTSVE